MSTRAALNVAWSIWIEGLTPEAVEELEVAFLPAEDRALRSRQERLAHAREMMEAAA